MSVLRAILEGLGLQEYFSSLTEYGFDTWDTLIDIRETDMASIGIKLGHRRKLQREIARRLGHHDDEPLFDSHAAAPDTSEQRGRGDDIIHPGYSKRRYRRRSPRDPHTPARPDTAYVAYAKLLRQDPQIAKLSFVEIAKVVGDRWSRLSDDIKDMWKEKAAAERAEYKSALAQYQQTEEYQDHIDSSKSKQPTEDRRDSQVKRNSILLENQYSSSESYVHSDIDIGQAIENSTNGSKIQFGSELTPYVSNTSPSIPHTFESIGMSPSRYRSSRTSVVASVKADQSVPVGESIWAIISQERASNPDTLLAHLSHDDLLPYTFQPSALSKSFHIQSINPFDFKSKETIRPMINGFLQNVNTIYYLVNPDDLWSHFDTSLDTSLVAPNLMLSLVCVCIALGCQTCSADTTGMDMAIMWYENGRRYLDDCDWCLDLTVMQILALISMFHMAQRPATSSHYLDAALHIGEANGLHKEQEDFDQAGIGRDVGWLDVWNTMKAMHRILLLGCGKNDSILRTPLTPPDNVPVIRHKIIRQQSTAATSPFSELSDFLGCAQQELDQSNTLLLWSRPLLEQKLETWLQQLPNELSLPMISGTQHLNQSLLKEVLSGASDAHKVRLLHFHSLYCGIIGLLKSPSLQQIVTTNTDQTTSVAEGNENDAYECLQSSFRLIDLCTAYSSVSPFPTYAWLPHCVLFTSSLTCILGIVWHRQLQAQGISPSQDLLDRSDKRLNNALRIFKNCATGNEQSQRHYMVLQRLAEWLQSSAI